MCAKALVAVISVKLPQPQFEGQTKGKLNSDIAGTVQAFVNERLGAFLEQNPPIAKRIINKAIEAARAREAARKARDLTRRKALSMVAVCPASSPTARSAIQDRCELYLVEGESAGGTAKQGRDRRSQAYCPQGKNSQRRKSPLRQDARPRRNPRHDHRARLPASAKTTSTPPRSATAKSSSMTDADVDGSHIRTLSAHLFFRHMTELIKRDNIYIAQPPLTKSKKGPLRAVHQGRPRIRKGNGQARVGRHGGAATASQPAASKAPTSPASCPRSMSIWAS